MFSWIREALSPLSCQSPVMPGLMRSLCLCSGLYCSTIKGISGLGPTIDILPSRTFRSCGSSSKLVRRRNLPILVILGSLETFGEYWYMGDPLVMVRNFHILKRRPFWPTRSCRKNTGPVESILIKTASTSNNGEQTISNEDEIKKSQK